MTPELMTTLPPRTREPLSIEDYIRDVVLRYQDSRSESKLAAMLGIGRKALWMRRKNWGLSRGTTPRQTSIQTATVRPSQTGLPLQGEVR